MDMRQQKKVLLLTGLHHEMEPEIYEVIPIKPDSMVTLRVAGPLIAHRYGDLMRTILLLVYGQDIEEIYVVGVHERHYITDDTPTLYDHLHKNVELRDKMQIINYLLSSNQIDFPNMSLQEWLSDGKSVQESVQQSVDMLSNHPLVPSDVRIHGLFLNEDREIVELG
ncbi:MULTISPECIES: hypothetical protein [unclassified Paenibacillus]|uniref:hypothetical protein n=1 Tax=unclassified Paenibacillus TaxID=185978 RepID=UPI00056C0FB6|nr:MULTISPECIES: hypothetical protein [unclassified Paenibacillus]MCT2196958.1 hypothetical protein [Paenibacillus sp. p3-SID1389]